MVWSGPDTLANRPRIGSEGESVQTIYLKCGVGEHTFLVRLDEGQPPLLLDESRAWAALGLACGQPHLWGPAYIERIPAVGLLLDIGCHAASAVQLSGRLLDSQLWPEGAHWRLTAESLVRWVLEQVDCPLSIIDRYPDIDNSEPTDGTAPEGAD